MSQSTAPAVEQSTNPVEAQEPSAGEQTASQAIHEAALRDDKEALNKAVAQAIQEQFAVTDAWKPKRIVKFVINCPSGQKVLAKHLDTMDLVKANLIEEMDFFMKKLAPRELDDQGNPVDADGAESIWVVLRDPEKRCQFLDLMNRLMAAAALKPRIINDGVVLVTNHQGEKEEVFGHQVKSIDRQVKLFGKPIPKLKDGEAYAGVIGFPDRMEFFTQLNKPLELIEPFREQANSVASMARSESSGNPTE